MLHEITEAAAHDQLAAPRWAARRLKSGISAATLAQDIAAARQALQTAEDASAEATLHSPLLRDVLQGARKLEGPPALMRGATPMTRQDYEHMLTRDQGALRQILVLAWLRAGRTADILALRVGSLWIVGGELAIELGQEKVRSLGLPGFIRVYLPSREREWLSPLISEAQPVTAPMKRPALFTTTYKEFWQWMTDHRPPSSTITPHSLRKGSINMMIRGGIPLKDIALISGHRSVKGLMAYVASPDLPTAVGMERASRAIMEGPR